MVQTSNINKGTAIKYKDQPWIITETQFENPGKGAAFTRAKMKNLKTGQVLENTFKSGESVEILDTIRKKCQFLYRDGNEFHFMDNETYDQFILQKESLEDEVKYLIDGTNVHVLFIEGNPISIQVPPKMDFKVVSTTPGVKGDTATGGNKDAEIETGAILKVPLFIKEGEIIKINTETGTYISKA